MTNVRVRLKAGSREIEAEGSMADVTVLLDKWWVAAPAGIQEPEEDEDEQDDATGNGMGAPSRSRPIKKRAARRASPAGGDSAAAQGGPDINSFANKVKEDEDYQRISDKIILGSSSLYHRVAFVCWYMKEPLTSGDVTRALLSLDIKMDTPRVSRELKKHSGKFTTTAQRQPGAIPRYKLTASANAEFEKWFNADA